MISAARVNFVTRSSLASSGSIHRSSIPSHAKKCDTLRRTRGSAEGGESANPQGAAGETRIVSNGVQNCGAFSGKLTTDSESESETGRRASSRQANCGRRPLHPRDTFKVTLPATLPSLQKEEETGCRNQSPARTKGKVRPFIRYAAQFAIPRRLKALQMTPAAALYPPPPSPLLPPHATPATTSRPANVWHPPLARLTVRNAACLLDEPPHTPPRSTRMSRPPVRLF